MSAAQGNVDAQRSVATCYCSGFGVQQDREKGEIWFCMAAKHGDEKSLKCANDSSSGSQSTNSSSGCLSLINTDDELPSESEEEPGAENDKEQGKKEQGGRLTKQLELLLNIQDEKSANGQFGDLQTSEATLSELSFEKLSKLQVLASQLQLQFTREMARRHQLRSTTGER